MLLSIQDSCDAEASRLLQVRRGLQSRLDKKFFDKAKGRSSLLAQGRTASLLTQYTMPP